MQGKLSDPHIEALEGALALAARVGGSYETYGGVNVTDTITYGNEAVEILRGYDEPKPRTVEARAAAAAEALRRQPVAVPDSVPDPVVITPRKMCRSCEAFLGYAHKDACEFDGVVASSQIEEKWTTIANSDEQPPREALPTPHAAISPSPRYDYRFEEQMGGEPPEPTDDSLTIFLYLLMRDTVNPGALEHIVCEVERGAELEALLTNRFLAGYADNLSKRITRVAGRRLGALQKETRRRATEKGE